MALPIKPTPKLNRKETCEFLAKIARDLKISSGPIPTPRINKIIHGAARRGEAGPGEARQGKARLISLRSK